MMMRVTCILTLLGFCGGMIAVADEGPGNLLYHGLYYHLDKVANRPWTRFEYFEGGIDYTDKVNGHVNFLNIDNGWMTALEPEASYQHEPECLPDGYGLESYFKRIIDEKEKMLIMSPGFQGVYQGTRTYIIPKHTDFRIEYPEPRQKAFVPWDDLTPGQKSIVRERFKLMWTGWDGASGCFPLHLARRLYMAEWMSSNPRRRS